jgi:uncharacterized protein
MLKAPISADSHIVEPPNCYVDHIDPAWRDRAPRVEKNAKGVDAFVIDGLKNAIPIGMLAAAGVPAEGLKAMRAANFADITPAAYDADERMAAQERDGIGGELIYASIGMVMCSHPDYEYKAACFAAYNRWLAEFCGRHPDRLFGLAQTAVGSVDDTIRDLEAAKAAGMVGMMMTGTPQHEDYDHPDYDALWEAAVGLDMPLCFHILTSNDYDAASAFRPQRGAPANGFMNIIRGVQDVLGVFLFGGVFDRFPDLKMVVAEGDAGWVPHWMYRADHAAERLAMGGRDLARKPSEYVKSNVRFTFQDDRTAYENAEMVESDCLLWANDFPHTDSTWPWSQEILARQTAHLSEERRNAAVHDNVKATFNLPV